MGVFQPFCVGSGFGKWGLASANPYAVRALEKATRRRCDTKSMEKNKKVLKKVVDAVPYLKDKELRVGSKESVVCSDFFQDLGLLPSRLRDANAKSPWLLGNLQDGEEWLATTFRSQSQVRWSDADQQKFMSMSNSIARDAYERMPQEIHSWANPKLATSEAEYIIRKAGLKSGSTVLDWGCGTGRHAMAFAKNGLKTVGVDFSESALSTARSESKSIDSSLVSFMSGDCRHVDLKKSFNCVVCLYDVVGSFPDEESNQSILKKAIDHIEPGGWLVLGVLSYRFMRERAKHLSRSNKIFDHLDDIAASNIMQESGEIFDPEFVLLDTELKLAYRKEMFDTDGQLPVELIVRDRRYELDEIVNLCAENGVTVVESGFVRAGRFDLVETEQSDVTKEILVLARKELI